MGKPKANFKVDTKLASILGENYRSTEYAIKELVDNAWDADAENVKIILPNSMTQEPITLEDDGSGMTEKEVRHEYLFIANSRTSRKGDKTPDKKRRVKGKKGIGKFSGLSIGSLMNLETYARGVRTTLIIDKGTLLDSKQDLEKVDLPVETESCKENIHGTKITISNLNQNYVFPNPEKLSEILVREYGREDGIAIFVNGKKIDLEDIKGNTIRKEIELPGVGMVTLKSTISDKPVKNAGIALRIGGKLVGKPSSFGIEENETIPNKLVKNIYAEIEADGLVADVTADWGAIVENSTALQTLQENLRPLIEDQIKEKYATEINLQKARNQRKLNANLSRLPEYKRQLAEKALDKLLKKFYAEDDEKFDSIISVVFDAIEKDEYYEVLLNIDAAKDSDVSIFAEALSQFGLAEMSFMLQQANNRLKFLDFVLRLSNDENALERDLHKAIERNLWILGEKYSLMASNETLKSIVSKILGKSYEENNPENRPDLLLSENYTNEYLLVEFKRPSKVIGRDDENQAEKYRDDLLAHLGKVNISILVIGGKVDTRIDSRNIGPEIQLLTFSKIISDAQNRINWLTRELRAPA